MEQENYPQATNGHDCQAGILCDPSPNRQDPDNKIRCVQLNQLSSGYVVNVGCQSFAFSTKEEMMAKLTEYINAPADTEKKWFDGKLF